MFKKAGTIVGVLIILIALGIYWGATKFMEPDPPPTDKPIEQPIQKEEPKQNQTPPPQMQPQTQVPPPQTNQQQTNAQTSLQDKPTYSTVDISQLGRPVTTKEEVMVVANKRAILLDSTPNSTEGKQLAYSLDILTAEGVQLTHFVTRNVYDAFAVGTQLKVNYELFENKNGVKFPSILSVESLY